MSLLEITGLFGGPTFRRVDPRVVPPGLAPAELSALLRLFKRRDRSNRLQHEPVEQHEEVTISCFSRKRKEQEQE